MSMGWGGAGVTLADGRYCLVSRAGSGGSAVVWRAVDTLLGREVAIKVLHAQTARDTELVSRLKAEAQAIAQLKHRHVTAVHDFGQEVAADGTVRPYVVMEFVEGSTVEDLLDSGEPMAWQKATAVAAQVASALAYAHECGIVHRDVTGANIILTDDGVKVLDFGIAALRGEPDSREGEEVLGTPAYIAPERLRSRHAPVTPAADVYGLGVTWYQMMSGTMPWQARSATGLIQAHLVYAPAPLPPIEGLPERLRELCMACLAKNPTERPVSWELAEELARYAGEAPPRRVSVITQALTRPRRARAFVAVGVTAVAAAALHSVVNPDPASGPRTQAPQANASATVSGSPGGPAKSSAGLVPLAPVGAGPGSDPQPTVAGSAAVTSPPAPSAASPSPTAEPVQVRTAGGLVEITCDGDLARIVEVTLRPGYTIKTIQEGPAQQVGVVLKSADHQVGVRGRCENGVVRTVVEENQRSAGARH